MTAAERVGLVDRYDTTAFGRLHFMGPAKRQSSEVVLMVHGFGSSWAVWIPLLEAAAPVGVFAGRDIMAIDLPGFGESENLLGHLDSAALGRELLDLIERLGYTRVRVAGHSMGGFLTLDMAARYPDRVASIHVVSGSYFAILGMVNHPVATSFKTPLVALFYWIQLFLSHHDRLSARLNAWLARRPAARAGQKPHYMLGGPSFRFGAANGVDYDTTKLWGSLTLPVYGAFGARDRLVPPSDMYQLQSIVPGAHLKLIPRAAHSSLVEQPVLTLAALFPTGALPPAQ